MARAKHPRCPRGATAAVAVAAALLLAPSSALAAAAVDEYSLGPVGGQNPVSAETPAGPGDDQPARQLGVVGENEPARSPLGEAGAAAWLAAGLVVALGAGIALAARGRPARGAA